MKDQEIIIKFLLEKVGELTAENKRLNDLVDELHADCYYYENHWKPEEEAEIWTFTENKKKKKSKNFVFVDKDFKSTDGCPF